MPLAFISNASVANDNFDINYSEASLAVNHVHMQWPLLCVHTAKCNAMHAVANYACRIHAAAAEYCTLHRDPAAPWPVRVCVDDLQEVRCLNPGPGVRGLMSKY